MAKHNDMVGNDVQWGDPHDDAGNDDFPFPFRFCGQCAARPRWRPGDEWTHDDHVYDARTGDSRRPMVLKHVAALGVRELEELIDELAEDARDFDRRAKAKRTLIARLTTYGRAKWPTWEPPSND